MYGNYKLVFKFEENKLQQIESQYMLCDIISDIMLATDNIILKKNNNLIENHEHFISNFNEISLNSSTVFELIINNYNIEHFPSRYPKNELYDYFGIFYIISEYVEDLLGDDEKSSDEADCCVICLTNKLKVGFEKCKHLVLCFRCYSKLQNKNNCVLCRTEGSITTNFNIKDMYLPF